MNCLKPRFPRLIDPRFTFTKSARAKINAVYLISDALPFGRLWYDTPDNAIGYAKHSSRSHRAVIRAYDAAGNVNETHQHAGDFKAWCALRRPKCSIAAVPGAAAVGGHNPEMVGGVRT